MISYFDSSHRDNESAVQLYHLSGLLDLSTSQSQESPVLLF